MVENLKIHWYHYLWIPLAILLIKLLFVNVINGLDDFDVFADAARKLEAGKNIYDPPYFNNLRYLYLPFFAWMLSAFNNIPVEQVKLGFLLFNILLLIRVQWIFIQYSKAFTLNKYSHFVWIIPISFLLFHFGGGNFVVMQLTIFILWCIIEGWWQLRNGNEWQAGIILALGAVVKVMPIVFILFYFYKGKFKLVLAAFATFLILLFIPALSIGVKSNLQLIENWLSIINPASENHYSPVESTISPDWQGLQSISAFWFNGTANKAGQIFLNIGRLLIVLGILRMTGFRPFKHESSDYESFGNMAVVALSIPVIFPHMRSYDYLLLIPAILWTTLEILSCKDLKRRTLLFAVYCIYCLFFVAGTDLIGNTLLDRFYYYRLYSYMAIGFIFWMAYFKREDKQIELG